MRTRWILGWCVIGVCLLLPSSALAQQNVLISGRIVDASNLGLPGVTVTITEVNTGFTRTTVTAETGAYEVRELPHGTYDVRVELQGFQTIQRTGLNVSAGSEVKLDFQLQIAGVEETITVTGAAPLVETTSNKIGGTLSANEIEDVPSNFRHIGALTQLVPGMTPNPAQSTFEGGQVTANGTVAQSNVYLLDGAYNNDDRLGGSQGTQVRVVLDNIEEYQVLSNQYSAEYGGGAGAIINMVTRGGTNEFSGRVYAYLRDDKFYARNAFLPDDAEKPEERTVQAGFAIGGPIVRNRAHFYFTLERDYEKIAGLKRFPPAAAPLARDFVGAFEVDAANYFGRGDVQLNSSNFLSGRWVLETAPTKGEGFNTSNETIDAQGWESDWDQIFNITLTSVVSDRASNVLRVGRIGEQLGTGAQVLFDVPNVTQIGFDGRDPFTLGQRNEHPSYVTGAGGTGVNTRIRTYSVDDSFSYFVPSLWGGEHTFKAGGGFSLNQATPRTNYDTGTFSFDSDLPYNPANPATYPFQFDVQVGPVGSEGFPAFARDRRFYFFGEDKWRLNNNLTLNLGLRYDHQRLTPESKADFAPRAGFAWDVSGAGTTVVRGGVGKFYAYIPNSIGVNQAQSGVITNFPSISIRDRNNVVLRPDMIADSEGNPGVAVLSAAGRAELARLREQVLAGLNFNRNPRVDDPNRRMAYQWAWSLGINHQVMDNAAVSVDYVANISRNQTGEIDINEPINGVRPGVDVFDPNGVLVPPEARGTNFSRVRQLQSNSALNGDYKSLQFSFLKRMANRWSGRVAYTVQRSKYVGLGNPDTRRVWLDNDIRADYGRSAFDRTHVLAMAGTWNAWRSLTIAGVLSAISGAPVNETVGRDVNGDGDNNDRPIAGIDDLIMPIRSELDSQGRAVINGLEGPGSFLVDLSVRYQIPLTGGVDSLDLFYDIFNLLNRENLVAPTGNRRSGNFLVSTAAQFPRQMQFGIRLRF